MKTKFVNQPFSKRAMMVLAVLFTTLTAGATEFITDVMVIGYKNETEFKNLQEKLEKEGWTAINKDLNAGAGGDFIHLLYKSEANTDGLNHGYITDFYILGSKSGSVDEEVTYQGRTYHLVSFEGSTEFEKSNGDLNRGCGRGSDYIYLYYTKDPMNEQAVSKIVFDNSESGALGNQGGSDGFDLNNGCENATKKIYMHITKNNASTVKYIEYTYDITDGLKSETKTCSSSKVVSSNDNSWGSGWYVVSGDVAINERPVEVSGTVNLILRDGCTLTVQPGIQVNEGNTLNIFAQSEGVKAGQLKILDPRHGSAGIGGYRADGGEIVIHGGMVEADGGFDGAGIGGGYQGSGGTVTIYGGTVEARGGFDSAGIGGGWKGAGGTVTIYGGKVKAKGYDDAAGIGGGDYSAAGTVIIYGGMVEAQGGHYAAGIGGGVQKPGGLVTIYGGAVEAYGGERSAGIGGGWEGSGGTVNIYGGTVKAHGGEKADGIGAGEDAWSHGTLKIGEGLNVFDGNNPSTPIATGPQENVESRTQYMGVGKMFPVPYLKYSFDEESKTLTSEKKYCDDYTEMTETTNKWSEGWYVVSGNVEISDRINFRGTMNLILCDGCTLTAKKGIDVWDSYSALNIFAQSEGEQTGKLKAIGKYDDSGIGDLSGPNANAGPVTIYGGVVEAYGGENSAGIDASYTIHGGEVTIYSGTVKAYGGKFGAGIGANKTAACGTVTVYGGTVEAYGGESGAGIGGCEGGAGGTVTIYGGVVEAHGDDEAAGIGAGSKGENHGTLIIDEGVKVYDGTNLSAPIAIGPENKIESRTQYMIAGDHLRGDANYDWKVNAADIVEMVNAKNDKASTRFVLKNADIDGDKKITQSDIDAVVKIILKKI